MLSRTLIDETYHKFIKVIDLRRRMNDLVQKEQDCLQILKTFANKAHVKFTKRCNEAILMALTYAKKKGKTRLCIPECGGFITYEQFGKKLGFEVVFVPTIDEVLDENFLKQELMQSDVLLFHRLAGYHTLLSAQTYVQLTKTAGALCVEDICGCVGKITPVGDIVVCSFGNAKPICVGEGGFIASDIGEVIDEESAFNPTIEFFEKLHVAIRNLDKTYALYYTKRDTLRIDIENLQRNSPHVTQNIRIIADAHAIVLIAEYATQIEKEQLVTLAQMHNLEYTQCPRYIRHNMQALSFEIKRLAQE
jgi:hypothetical protein